jgi:hypothetical protein
MSYQQKIITANSPEALNSKIKEAISDGWKCIGSHTAMRLHAQLRYSGSQHMDTLHKAEYAQTIRKEEARSAEN